MKLNRKLTSLLPGLLAVAAAAGALAPSAHAWKPKTHIYLAEEALKDALDNGKVTLYETDYRTGKIIGTLGEFDVDAKILAALRAAPQQYRAGVLGPDAYPDILTGQQIVHPEEAVAISGSTGGTDAWLSHLWNRGMNSTPEVQAFTVGYLTHAAGDVFAHTFVNHFSGGEFMLIPDPTNAIKHLIFEGYIGKRTPAIFGSNGAAISQNDTSIAGVEGFIYDEMTFSRPGSILEQNLLKGEGTSRSIPFIFSTLRNGLQKDVEEYDRVWKSKTIAGRTAYAITNGPAAEYKRAWVKDIDDGLKAWPGVSHEIAKALVYNENGTDMKRAREVMDRYVREHLASMAGTPDAIVGTANFINAVMEKILPQAMRDKFKELMMAPLDFIAKGITGKSLSEWESYLKNPETHFDPVMNRAGGGHGGEVDHQIDLATFNRDYLKISDPGYNNSSLRWQIDQFPPAFNTLQMCKMLLLGTNGMQQMVAALQAKGATSVPTPNVSNAMLGWVRSLDAGNQWQGLPGKTTVASPQPFFAKNNGAAYQKLFLHQVGEKEWITGTSPSQPAPVAQDLSKWAGEWYTTMGRVNLAQESDGALRGRLMSPKEFGPGEVEGSRVELRGGTVEGSVVGTLSYAAHVSQTSVTLSADAKAFSGTFKQEGIATTYPWSGTRTKPGTTTTTPPPTTTTPPTTTPPTTTPPPATSPGTVPGVPVTPPAGTSTSIAGDGKFYPLSKFDVRLDKVEVARDRSLHAFVTIKNPGSVENMIINNSIQAFIEDADGVALKFADITRASTVTPEPFSEQPRLAPGTELKARFVLPTLKGGAPVRSLTLKEDNVLTTFDLSSIGVPDVVTEPFTGAPGASPDWKELGNVDVRFDGARPQRGTQFTEMFFTLKNVTKEVQFVGTPFRISSTDADGLVLKDQGQIYTVRGINPEWIVYTPWVLPGREMRLRFLIRGKIGNSLTVESAHTSAKQTFAAAPTAAP